MGWSSGTRLIEAIAVDLKKEISDIKTRHNIYKILILRFEDADWDNVDEPMGIDEAYDSAARELHPDWEL